MSEFHLSGFESPVHALVVGASGGIGAEIADLLANCPDVAALHCSARDPAASARLGEIVSTHTDVVHTVALDLEDESGIAGAFAAIRTISEQIDLVVCCAGVLHDERRQPPLTPERRLSEVDARSLERSFRVNAVGPLLIAKHVSALLPRRSRAVFASLSARVGSIADNRLGGWYGYRGSKAAHNMFLKTASVELVRRASGVICVALHPGTVDTPLSKPFQGSVAPEKLFDVQRAAAQLLSVINGLEKGDNGSFRAWDGTEIPW